MGTGAVSSAPLHPALLDYACLDALVRPALGLPPHHGPPDAFALALAVGLLFQRFVNACSAAHVSSTEPWMHALAFADEVLPSSVQAPLSLGEAQVTAPIPAAASIKLCADKLEDTLNAPSPHAHLGDGPRDPTLIAAEPGLPKSEIIEDPVIVRRRPRPDPGQPSTSRKPPADSATPTRRAPDAGPSNSALLSPALDKLRPHIRAILTSPDVDCDALTPKQLRQRLVARAIPGVTADWAHENKARLKPVFQEEHRAFKKEKKRAEHQVPSSLPSHETAATPLRRQFGPVSAESEAQKRARRCAAFGPSSSAATSTVSLAPSPTDAPHHISAAADRAWSGHDAPVRGFHGPTKPFSPAPGGAAVSASVAESSKHVRLKSVLGGFGPDRLSRLRVPLPAAGTPSAPKAVYTATASSAAVSASAGQKRPRSATPDSDEDEFAASFMRKRKVSASLS